jgi:histidinol dehydrogenase
MLKSFLQDDNGLTDRLLEFCSSSQSDDVVINKVAEILSDVRNGGDGAMLKRTFLYDKVKLGPNQIKVSQNELEAAKSQLTTSEKESILEAIENVSLFHERTLPENWSTFNNHGAKVGEKYYPINRVGIYVPGGNVPLISTVVMTVTIAKVAKVKQIVIVTPPDSEGKIAPQMLAALEMLGVNEIYKVGGAQAIGALAYGTETITPVDKIFGPGNSFVNEAKRQVYGTVGIDLLPGPSELMVIADASSNPAFVAAALLSQAEHGSGKEKIFLLFSEMSHFDKITNEIDIQLKTLSHQDAIEGVLNNGFIAIYLPSFKRIAEVATYIAPEHLELQVAEEHIEFLTSQITTAGAFLLGHITATSLGDFLAGPSHVLPTGRSSRFSSGLRLQDFLRRSSFIQYDKKSALLAKKAISVFSEMEQLDGHGKSFSIRL